MYWCNNCKLWIDEQKCLHCDCIGTYTSPQKLTFEEMCDNGDLCDYCDDEYKSGGPDYVCEGRWCNEAYDNYLESEE